MEKEVVIWTFIIVFVATAIITLLGIIKKFKWIEIDDKYLKVLSATLILEVVTVIIGFGASSFNELDLEKIHQNEISKLSKIILTQKQQVQKLKQDNSASQKEIELKNIEITRVRTEKEKIESTFLNIKRSKEKKENERYTFENAETDFNKAIYFKYKTKTIDSKSKELLIKASKILSKLNNVTINLYPYILNTYTDNFLKDRQLKIRNFLVSQGFSSHKIILITDRWIGNTSNERYDEDNDLIEKTVKIELVLIK